MQNANFLPEEGSLACMIHDYGVSCIRISWLCTLSTEQIKFFPLEFKSSNATKFDEKIHCNQRVSSIKKILKNDQFNLGLFKHHSL